MPKNPYNFTPSTLKGQLPVATGDVIFVDSVNGASGADGSSLRPYSTIEGALNKSGLSAGDTIIVMPSHAETISSATALNLDTAGISIIGLGIGTARPTITMDTATTTTIPVTAANISLKNIVFSMNYADIVSVFTLTTAKNFTVDNCEVKDTATNMNVKYLFDTGTTANAADGLTVTNCKWVSPDAATIAVCKVDGTNDSWKFKNNYFNVLAQAAGGSLFTIATGKVLTNVEVEDNRAIFTGGDLSGAGVVVTTDGSTNSGHFSRNYIQHTDTGSEIFCTATSGFSFFENRMSGVAGATGYVLPAVDS